MNIVIIGAARSGTNMLRDLLTELNDFATWPCDEINYIWRYGNKTIEHDELSIENINSKNKEYINKQFRWVKDKYQVNHVIEKTCANSLRVDFVDSIVEDAKYLFIFRDPIDVIASADKRWKASLDLKYTAKKARFIPKQDIPYYGGKYLLNRLQKFWNNEKRLSYWGPKYTGFENDAEKLSAVEISAKQWKKSVSNTMNSLLKMQESKYIAVEYNDLVRNPEKQIKFILDSLHIEYNYDKLKSICSEVSAKSIGKGYETLSDEEIAKINGIVGNTYQKLLDQFIEV
ncbi:sulfotransferase family protein [Alkalibacillus almallahensis]|uniref:sulfotransferase family protein n=1 Tax=Alkalibacillus almallahensis TaxID=1379154 RepID=UPI001420E779|nr:sulfotransferase [Alkalibacillus almallahensis]NIK11798.1 hypothetical protein [Alkalibacillus almallahensis]